MQLDCTAAISIPAIHRRSPSRAGHTAGGLLATTWSALRIGTVSPPRLPSWISADGGANVSPELDCRPNPTFQPTWPDRGQDGDPRLQGEVGRLQRDHSVQHDVDVGDAVTVEIAGDGGD